LQRISGVARADGYFSRIVPCQGSKRLQAGGIPLKAYPSGE